MNKLDKVRELIAHLSQAELREVRDYTSMRMNSGLATNELQGLDESDMLLDVIFQVMRGRGLDMSGPPGLKKSSGFPAFRLKVAELHPFLALACPGRVARRALMQTAIELLVDNLHAMNVAVSSRTVMSHIHRIPAVLDLAFPGYAVAGRLHLVPEDHHVRKEPSHKTVPRRGR